MALFHGGENDFVQPGLLRFSAGGVANLVTQCGRRAVLRIAGGAHSELADQRWTVAADLALVGEGDQHVFGPLLEQRLLRCILVILHHIRQADLLQAIALGWGVICFLLSGISYDPVRANLWPLSLHSTRHYFWTPADAQYQSVTLEQHIEGTVYGSRNLDRPFPEISDKLKYELVGTINGPNGPTILEVDLLHGMAWQLSHSGGGQQKSGLKLDKAAMLDWFKAAGASPSDRRVKVYEA